MWRHRLAEVFAGLRVQMYASSMKMNVLYRISVDGTQNTSKTMRFQLKKKNIRVDGASAIHYISEDVRREMVHSHFQGRG